VGETERGEPSVRRPPLRKVLIQLIVIGAQTVALVVIDKTLGDGIAFAVAFLGYGGVIAWWFWSNRYH
jgi:hypothetical protein